jgi:Arc/MetJ-type ribon-helix-helix transcriptional regulator
VASRTVRARLDDASEEALATLVREGRNESEAVRTALIEAASRRKQRSALATEVRRLAEDPVDTAERQAIMDDMETIASEWPE